MSRKKIENFSRSPSFSGMQVPFDQERKILAESPIMGRLLPGDELIYNNKLNIIVI
jgi:hypothetical protein